MRQKPNTSHRRHPSTGDGCAALPIHSRQASRHNVLPESKSTRGPKRAKSQGVLPSKIFGAGTILDRRWGHLL